MTAPRIHATRRPVRHPFAPGSPSAPFAAGGVEPVGHHAQRRRAAMTTRPITTAEQLLRASRVADTIGLTQLQVLGIAAYVTGADNTRRR